MGLISEGGVSRRTPAISAGVLAIVFAAMLWIASSAQAAELVYWDNYEENTVSFANIDGSGGGPLNLTGSTLENPEGMAIDSATGRLFVASAGEKNSGKITAINLDGSGATTFSAPGAPIDVPEGIVIDPVKRIVYWANTGTNPSEGSIAWANLDGSAGGTLNTSGATLAKPYRIGFDPVAGKVYWANSKPAAVTVSFANTNNSGGGDLSLAGAPTPKGLSGFAVDSAAGRLYLLDSSAETVSFVSLGGGNGGTVNLTGATISNPYGLALDPSIGRLYWGNYGNAEVKTGAIGYAATGGGGGGAINIATAPVKGVQDPTILKSPNGTEAPKVNRSKKSRSSLECSTGGWAADYAGSFVYQAPHTFAYQWTRNGKSAAGATVATLNAKSAGKYACLVTATNQAGSASQTSAALNVKAAKLKLTTKKVTAHPGGLATFKVNAINQGDIKSKSAKVCVKVPKSAKGDLKAPKCKSLGALKGRGKRGVTLKVKVGPSAGGAYKVTFSVKGASGKAAKAKLLVH